METMKASAGATLVFLLLLPSLALAQSLGELAAKEKERRQKNKERGKAVRVITESELAGGEQGAEPGTAGNPSSSPSSVSSSAGEDDVPDTGSSGPPAEIPRNAPLESRIQAFEALKKGYEQEVARIDQEIAKNKDRLLEIEQKLASLGAGGLPVAPQVDRGARYDGEFFGLMDEKGKLLARNEELESKKQSLWEDVVEKARKAGVPPGYVRR
jgi:hypothetical protein